MIDDNKITEAFKMYNEKVENELAKRLTRKPTSAERYADTTLRQCAFIAGVKWMQEEFLKDLWHPASEEPKCHSYIMFKTTNNNGFGTEYIDCSWKTLARCLQITQWLYIDDLLPKKGGENERD